MPWSCVYIVWYIYSCCMLTVQYVYVFTVAPRGAPGRVLTPRYTGNLQTMTNNPASTAKKVFNWFYITICNY